MEGLQYGIQQGYNPMTAAAYASQAYGSQFGPQGQFGQQFGGANTPLGGLLGSGIAGLMSGVNGGMQPYNNNLDPLTAAHIQQAQLAQQAQQTQLAQQAQLAQLIQQVQQLAQQLAQQQQFGRLSFGQQAQLTPWSGSNPLNRIDPITAAYIQQAQVAQLLQQLGQQGQFPQLGHGQFGQNPLGFGQSLSGLQGQGQFGQQAWPGGGQNPWANPQLATQGGRAPLQYGSAGGQLPVY